MAEKDLNIYLTGVAADGNAQTNPNNSLGGKRSGTILNSLTPAALVNNTGIVITDVSANCGTGNMTLVYVFSGQTLAFTAPGDTAGIPVAIGTNGVYEIYSADTTKYAIVTVTAASLAGVNKSDTVALTRTMDGLFADAPSTEAVAGSTKYRSLIVKNTSAATMYGAVVWINQNTPFTADEIQIGLEPTVTDAIQTIANENTAPTAITFSLAATLGAALSIGDLAAGATYGLWIRRVITATALRYASNNFMLTVQADTV